MECRMDGRVALITGGSRGLGRAMAETFLKAGAKVAIVARRPDVLQETVQAIAAASDSAIKGYQNMAEDHTFTGVGECHPYREFEGMQPSR